MRMRAPPLETERLTLRGHTPDDLAEYAAMWGDPEVVRHIGGRPFTSEECWHRLLRGVGHWEVLGFGYWVVRERASGGFVGEVGFADLRRILDPPFGDAPEMGWVLATSAHGRGFAGEAVGAALAWARERWGPRRTVCMIDPDNRASLRVAARAGFREYARATYRDAPAILLERLPA
jgi:RimJ/RimL family protein N-acetyltransferase